LRGNDEHSKINITTEQKKMEQKKVKHGGCKECGSKDQEILTSVKLPGEFMGIALCDKCLVKRGFEKSTVKGA
jgi:hypothetical protein